jgi:hypothetical protein
LIGLLTWGQELDGHSHVPVARIRRAVGHSTVVWFRGADNQPCEEAEYSDLDKSIAALDAAI